MNTVNNQLVTQHQAHRATWTAYEEIYQPPEPSETLTNAVIELFGYFKTNFGTKFKQEEWGRDRVNMWAVALTELQITPREFSESTRKVRHQSWQPTTPADFLALSREASNEYPDSYTAYQQAANGNYLHPACHEAAKRIGVWELARQSEFIAIKKWNEIYKQVCLEHSQDSAKFNQNIAAIESKRQSDTKVLDKPVMTLEEQSAIATAALKKIREIL